MQNERRSFVPSLSLVGATSIYAVHPQEESMELEELEEAFIKQVGYVASINPLKKGYIINFYDTETTEKAFTTKVYLKNGTMLKVRPNNIELASKVLRNSTHHVVISPIDKGATWEELSSFLKALIVSLPLSRRRGEYEELIAAITELVEPK